MNYNLIIEIFKEKEEFMEEKVLLKDMVGTLKNCEFKNAVIPMGIDETGNFVYENYSKMNNIFICGATGSGKSVFLDNILLSLTKQLNLDKLEPLDSRTNDFKHIPVLPSVEKDLSVLVPEEITWKEIENAIKNRVDGIKFIEEYRGNQIPEGQKSISFKFTIDNKETTMTAEQINEKMNSIIKELNRKCKSTLREE